MRQRSSATQTAHPFPLDIKRAAEMSDAGLILGRATRLGRITAGAGNSGFAAERERLIALLSVAWRRPVTADVLSHFEAATMCWKGGDKALANLRLIFADLPQLDDADDAARLQAAAYLLDRGVPPRMLMEELGLDTSALDLEKYDPDQPRVPAGSGRASGQWTSGSSDDALLPPLAASRSFLGAISPDILASLTAFAARFATPTAVLGALFIPTPNSGGVTRGTLPDAPDIRFENDGPSGVLRLFAAAEDGSDVVVAAQNRRGLYVDLATGQAIGRDLSGQLYLDLDAVNDAIEDAAPAEGEPEGRPKAGADEPKLCPAPTPDVPHGASNDALDYEDDVHARVNPIAPIPRKFGVNLLDPTTGEIVYFDDCFRYAGDLVDGDMQAGDLVEAKGPRFAYLLSQNFGERIMDDLVTQARKEETTADARGVRVKWYFAEHRAADIVRARLEQEGLGDIVVSYMPPRRLR